MLRELGCDHPDISADVLADVVNFPGSDPLLELKSEDERAGASKMLHWLLADIGADGIVVKVTALRYLMRIEPRPMAVVAKQYNVTRQAISKQVNRLADPLGLLPLRSQL